MNACACAAEFALPDIEQKFAQQIDLILLFHCLLSAIVRRPRYEEVIGSGALQDGLAADDGVGLLFEGRNFAEAVASLPGQHAYRVERRRGNSVEETQIRARLLR